MMCLEMSLLEVCRISADVCVAGVSKMSIKMNVTVKGSNW